MQISLSTTVLSAEITSWTFVYSFSPVSSNNHQASNVRQIKPVQQVMSVPLLGEFVMYIIARVIYLICSMLSTFIASPDG